MQAPFYVIDNTRNLVFGQFFQQDSAEEVASILKHHSIDGRNVRIIDADNWYIDGMMRNLGNGQLRKGTEADLQSIDAEKYLPRAYMHSMGVGHVVAAMGSSQQMVVIAMESSGHKWVTWSMRGLSDGKMYRRKCPAGSNDAKFLRMATPNELHGARAKREAIIERKEERRDTNQKQAMHLNIQEGDVVIMNWGNVGPREEVVEAVNWKEGRVALRRRGTAALVREKRRFVSAQNITKVVEKGPGYYKETNPMYAKYGFRAPTAAEYKEASDINVLQAFTRGLRAL